MELQTKKLEIVFAFSHSYLLSLLLIACLGAIETLFGALSVTSLQTMAPDRLRGRVVSVYILAFNGSTPLGFFLSGWLASLFGPANCLLLCALLCLLITAAAWLWRKPAERNFTASVPV